MRRKCHPNYIKHYRRVLSWGQKELASRVGCHQHEISAYERGLVMPSLELALRIVRALGRGIEDVFFGLVEFTRDQVRDREDQLDDQPLGNDLPA